MPASQRFSGKVVLVKYSMKWADLLSRVTCEFHEKKGREVSSVSLNSIHHMFILALNLCNFFILRNNSHMPFIVKEEKGRELLFKDR